MTCIDITRELLTAPVYPGDPAPRLDRLYNMQLGDVCNLSALYLSLHNGTHLDAPRHFLTDGRAADELPPETFIGPCRVLDAVGVLTEALAREMQGCLCHRVLLKGTTHLTPGAAQVFADAGVWLVGVEGISVAAAPDEAATHRLLLGSGVAVLEGLELTGVAPGDGFLVAAPLKIAEADGAPVRAFLLRDESPMLKNFA